MDKDELLERYEALGEQSDFLAAKAMFEQEIRERASSGEPDALLHRQYGYLLECHGRITIRCAIEQYERSIELDPDQDKARYQRIGAKATLGEAANAVAEYKERAAAAPGDLRALRLLSAAYLAAKDFEAASEVIAAGLAIEPDDPALVEARGDVKAARGDADGALADWRRAVELEPENLSGVYSSAFLLEHERRLADAAKAWQYIVGYCEARGWELTAAWPRQELERVRRLLAGRPDR
jgi:tetratricopeptide (TPR) repeat protein